MRAPDGWELHRRTPRGWEIETVELIPADTDPDMVTDQPGRLSEAAVAVLIRSWTDRRQTPHDMARAMAQGRMPELTVKELVWHGWWVRDGRLNGRISGGWDTVDDAARRVVAMLPHRQAG